MRRMIDLIFAIVWLGLTFPLLIVVALMIAATSRGSVLYMPKVVGLNGRIFPLLRFRTMYVDNSSTERFTHIGQIIRNYSLDHLPQLINLLWGDLSLIGPRPMELASVDLTDPVWRRYVAVKPGLFNYAVLKLGSHWTPSRLSDPARNQQLELDYIQQRSWRFDIKIFLRSLDALLRSQGNIKARKPPDSDLV